MMPSPCEKWPDRAAAGDEDPISDADDTPMASDAKDVQPKAPLLLAKGSVSFEQWAKMGNASCSRGKAAISTPSHQRRIATPVRSVEQCRAAAASKSARRQQERRELEANKKQAVELQRLKQALLNQDADSEHRHVCQHHNESCGGQQRKVQQPHELSISEANYDDFQISATERLFWSEEEEAKWKDVQEKMLLEALQRKDAAADERCQSFKNSIQVRRVLESRQNDESRRAKQFSDNKQGSADVQQLKHGIMPVHQNPSPNKEACQQRRADPDVGRLQQAETHIFGSYNDVQAHRGPLQIVDSIETSGQSRQELPHSKHLEEGCVPNEETHRLQAPHIKLKSRDVNGSHELQDCSSIAEEEPPNQLTHDSLAGQRHASIEARHEVVETLDSQRLGKRCEAREREASNEAKQNLAQQTIVVAQVKGLPYGGMESSNMPVNQFDLKGSRSQQQPLARQGHGFARMEQSLNDHGLRKQPQDTELKAVSNSTHVAQPRNTDVELQHKQMLQGKTSSKKEVPGSDVQNNQSSKSRVCDLPPSQQVVKSHRDVGANVFQRAQEAAQRRRGLRTVESLPTKPSGTAQAQDKVHTSCGADLKGKRQCPATAGFAVQACTEPPTNKRAKLAIEQLRETVRDIL